MTLRANTRRQSREVYAHALAEAGIGAVPVGASGLLLEKPVGVEQLPGFFEGRVSVQDYGAQRAAELLDLADGLRVLDACSAPGGKTAHILELAQVQLLALDADPKRCQRVEENLARLGLAATVKAADARRPEDWWDGRPFDRILADVPCSASGVARRHPDIKWLRRPEDIAQFAAQQAVMLDALWRLLEAGALTIPLMGALFIPVLLAMRGLYPWVSGSAPNGGNEVCGTSRFRCFHGIIHGHALTITSLCSGWPSLSGGIRIHPFARQSAEMGR